jgi:hypothetical protein
MTSYNIERWDVILYGTNYYFPIIYFKPDEDLIEFFKANNNAVIANISESKSVYDNKNIPGVINTLEDNIPNSRPNLFDKTGYYVMTLYSEWLGYPMYGNLGKITFSGFNNTPPVVQNNFENNSSQNMIESSSDSNKKSKEIKIAFTYIIVIIVVLLFIVLLSKLSK